MEPDRYEESHIYFIIGIIGLVGSLALFAFSVYISPHLMFGWHYKMPDFIIWTKNILHLDYHWSIASANWVIVLFFWVCTGIFVLIANIASNKVEKKIYYSESDISQENKSSQRNSFYEAILLVFKLVLLLLGVYGMSLFFHWIISTPPPLAV